MLIINWRDIKNPLAGGAEVYLQEIFRRIVARGHGVTQLAVRFPGASETESIDGIRVIRFGGAQTFNFAVWRRLNRTLKSEHYDIVIDDQNKIPFYSPWFCDKPVLILMMHMFRKSIFTEVSFPFAAYVYLAESLIPHCYKNNQFAVLSPSSSRDLLAFGIPAERQTIIPPGTDTARFRPDPSLKRENLILHVGRLKRYKSTDQLLQAAKLLSAKRQDFRVKIVGDGDDLPRLRALSAELALDRFVEFTGFVPEEDKIKLYRQSALLVENSIKEGWGLIVMEANACGTPVVSSRSPGLVDAVDEGRTGFLYQYGNVPELAQRIEQLLDNPALRAEMGRNAIAWAAKYTWDHAADAMLKVIERVVAQRPGP
jgi:glycosyltransferase involved in cell wall biosynthesis